MIALGFDPGFASFGWGVADLSGPPGAERVLALGVIRTKKGKGKILNRDDDHRRSGEIARALFGLAHEYRPSVVCAEALSHGKGAGGAVTMAKMGRAWGIVDALVEVYDVALLQVSPQDIKKACTGAASASKAEVQAALDHRFAGAVSEALRGIRATRMHEHPVDALGAIVACLDDDRLRLARRAMARSNA